MPLCWCKSANPPPCAAYLLPHRENTALLVLTRWEGRHLLLREWQPDAVNAALALYSPGFVGGRGGRGGRPTEMRAPLFCSAVCQYIPVYAVLALNHLRSSLYQSLHAS